jgi:hypothetical protein
MAHQILVESLACLNLYFESFFHLKKLLFFILILLLRLALNESCILNYFLDKLLCHANISAFFLKKNNCFNFIYHLKPLHLSIIFVLKE